MKKQILILCFVVLLLLLGLKNGLAAGIGSPVTPPPPGLYVGLSSGDVISTGTERFIIPSEVNIFSSSSLANFIGDSSALQEYLKDKEEISMLIFIKRVFLIRCWRTLKHGD